MLIPVNPAPQQTDKAELKQQQEELRLALLERQRKIRQQHRGVLIVVAGDDRSGRQHCINTLVSWLDPRFVQVHAYRPNGDQEAAHPFFWRYWRDLPAGGQLGIYLRDWTSTTLDLYLNDLISEQKLQQRLTFINQFERDLHNDGALIIKLWLHLDKDAHAQRLTETANTPFFETKDALALHNFEFASERIDHVLKQTQSKHRRWTIINSEDSLQRDIVAAQTVVKAIDAWLEDPNSTRSDKHDFKPSKKPWLQKIDLSPSLSKDDYKTQLAEQQALLRHNMTLIQHQDQAVVVVFEGVDAAGKGGAIRRIAHALDAGYYRIVPIAAPSDEEKARHYLWRFWRHVPGNGYLTIFDRSWYGRVLVERIEGFAEDVEWQQAYAEINDFEAQLQTHGVKVIKFWLHIDEKEQLDRFNAREETPHKQHKITEEDYRNREQWPAYEAAINDMIEYTSTKECPWHLIAANDKRHARVEILKRLNEALQSDN